jgi:hypothetical protein
MREIKGIQGHLPQILALCVIPAAVPLKYSFSCESKETSTRLTQKTDVRNR